MKDRFLRAASLVMILVLCLLFCLPGCKKQNIPPASNSANSLISGLESSLPSPAQKGEHYNENMQLFGDFLSNVYAYECVYQFYKNADRESAFIKATELKKMLLFSINSDYFLDAAEKSEIEKNAENYLKMQYYTLDLSCEENSDAISKELFGISFKEYINISLCESMAEKCRNDLVDKYFSEDLNETEIENFYIENKTAYDFAVLRYISYKLNPGGSSSSNQSITREAENLCSRLNSVEEMLNIIGGESDKQSEGSSNGQITIYMNETTSLFYEFAETLRNNSNAVNSKTVIHDDNNAYVVMCEGYFTWDNSETVKSAVKKAYAQHKANDEMVSKVDLKYSEPGDWYKMSGVEEIKAAKYSGDYSSVISKLNIAEKAKTLFLTVQRDGETTACDFYAFNKSGSEWKQVFNTEGYVGRSGVEDPVNRVEGNGTTPSGVYSFGMLFGINDNPGGLKKNYKKVDEDDYWDGDSYSDTYNQYVRGSEMPSSWNSNASEHLIDYKYSYNYAVMVNYNVNPTVKGKGSAIFLHCTRPGALYSAGCISIPEDKMIKSLRMIDDNAYIVIVREIEDILKFC